MFRQIVTSVKRRIPRRIKELYWRLPALQSTAAVRLTRVRKLLHVVGLWNLPFLLSWLADWEHRSRRYELRIPRYHHALTLRGGTSDLAVFDQIFLTEQYADLPIHDPHIIVDAGANIGLTSLYFLRHYPNSQVIALEPDPDNFDIASRNLGPYRSRCHLILGALWSHHTHLALRRRDKHWATQVVEGNGSVEGFSIKDLLVQFRLSQIDLLKVDIEGSESAVFSNEAELELRRIACCVIELHGEECERIFRNAIAPHGFLCSRRGELTIALNPAFVRAATNMRRSQELM